MLISRMTRLICGSLISEFESFMISVDFCSEPVTFDIAKKSFRFEVEFLHMPLTQLLRQLCPDRTQPRLAHR